MIRWLAVAVAMALAAAAGPVSAQTDENVLRGLTRMQLLVEDFADEDARKCNVVERDITDEFAKTIAALGRFRLVRDADVIAYVNPTILHVNDGICMLNLQLQVFVVQTVRLPQSNRTIDGTVELWTNSFLGYRAPATFAALMRERVADLAKDLIKDWNADNR